MTNDNNTTSVWGFIKDYVFWQVIFLIWHRNLLFKCVDGKSYYESSFLLWSLIIASALVCCFIIVKHNRNMVNVFVSTLLPLELYTIITYFCFFEKVILIILGVLLVMLIAYGILMFARKIKNKERYYKIVLNRISKYVYFSRIMTVMFLSLIVAPIIFKAAIGQPLYQAKTHPIEATTENTYTIANNIETVCMLQETIWEGLTFDEKIEVLQVIANIEANYLGIPTELRVTADNLGVWILGQYRDSEHRISIDIDHLKNGTAHEVLETLCHEAYHGYEKRLTDLYGKLTEEERRLKLFTDAEEYTREFADYKTDEGYYAQSVERDSRKYAKDAVNDYYSRIDKYLEKECLE